MQLNIQHTVYCEVFLHSKLRFDHISVIANAIPQHFFWLLSPKDRYDHTVVQEVEVCQSACAVLCDTHQTLSVA